MIINPGCEARRVIVGLGVALLVWFGGMAALALLVEPPAVVVFGPTASLIAAVDAGDASILSMGKGFVTAKANGVGLVRRLYAGGAWFVWPALQATCRPGKRSL
ncbi:hypothetical protein [Methylocapsa sp. S129]|uniref:hypothetical protein n=1 Tax=Methylocapsa sp. S129 TaxID=1641869 RepID=UPI001FEE0FB9|nr:hypothetical protein [Methylocapsa sp. S129]